MLFKDSNILKQYAEFTEINFASVALTIKQVEATYLVPIIGSDLYLSLNTAYNAAASESNLTATQQALLDACRMLIGPYVAYNYLPKADLQLSDAGARRAETQSLKTAYGYQSDNYREQKLTEGENAAEALLQYLTANATLLPEWTGNSAYTNYQSLFIKSGADFSTYFTTATPYRNYWAWRYKMLEVEENSIRMALTDAVFRDMKTKDQAGTALSAKETSLMFMVKKAIAYLTVSYAIPFHNVRVDSNGITVVAVGNNPNVQQRMPANNDVVTHLMRNCADAGSQWLNQAVALLVANPTDFPLYPQPPAPNDDSDSLLPIGNSSAVASFGLY